MGGNVKRNVLDILEYRTPDSLICRLFNVSIISLIVLNVAAVILETVSDFSSSYSRAFRQFEVFSVAVFTIEYVVRLWSCTADKTYQNPVLGRLRYVFTPMVLVDLLAILPFYIPLLIPIDLRILRALRLLRLFRMFKLGRYSDSLKMISTVFREKKEELFITGFVVTILLVLSSSLMYFVEHDVQPDVFSSIPATMWWGVSTLTTVGYGDVYPVTSLGKLIGALIAFLGVGMFALPAGILASGFAEAIRARRNTTCPHCGRDL